MVVETLSDLRLTQSILEMIDHKLSKIKIKKIYLIKNWQLVLFIYIQSQSLFTFFLDTVIQVVIIGFFLKQDNEE
jgi:hypothetical protein